MIHLTNRPSDGQFLFGPRLRQPATAERRPDAMADSRGNVDTHTALLRQRILLTERASSPSLWQLVARLRGSASA